MRVECRDNGSASFVARMMDRPGNHGLMTGMEAVEISKRDDAATQLGFNRFMSI